MTHKTFAEMEEGDFSLNELEDALSTYADKGASLCPEVIMGLVIRVDPSVQSLKTMIAAVERGINKQQQAGQKIAAQEYIRVKTFLTNLLAKV